MSYKHDIFISYRRDNETKYWISEHFIPLLINNLDNELGYRPEIFIDQDLETGISWPIQLGEEIGCSKILIILWTRTYLNSVWCACEMSHMLQRELAYGYRQSSNSNGLIIPIIVHDGETLPPPLAIGQKLELQDCFNTRMSRDSPRAEKLAENIRKAAQGIAKLIKEAPAWEASWKVLAANQFFNQYYKGLNPDPFNLPKFT